jgi:hypothetical protein
LYRASEIQVGDEIPELGTVKRIARRLGEVDLYWGLMPLSFVRLGVDTPVLAHRQAGRVVTIGQASQTRPVPGLPAGRVVAWEVTGRAASA